MKPKMLRFSFQDLGWQRGEAWPPVGSCIPQHLRAGPKGGQGGQALARGLLFIWGFLGCRVTATLT